MFIRCFVFVHFRISIFGFVENFDSRCGSLLLIFLCRSPDLARDDTVASEFVPEKDICGRHFLFDKKCKGNLEVFHNKM